MRINQKIETFIKKQGRRPRILVSNLGRKDHDPDNNLLASFFAESGFDVDISPLNQTPAGTARMALENDDHIICIISIENRHKTQITNLARELKAENAGNVRIIIGGAVPRSDYKYLYDAGVDLILGSVPVDKGEIDKILELLEK